MTSITEGLQRGLPVATRAGALRPLGMDEVTIVGGFWGDRQEINGAATIEHCEMWIERAGWIGNFDAAIEGRLPQAHAGRSFADSDVYKLIEAMAWEFARTGDLALNARIDALVARIAPVQEPGGYLNTYFGRPGQKPRYSDLEWGHELYCYGHLLQAAIARGRSFGDDQLVAVARRAADHVCDVFGSNGLNGVCGHPEIEVALAEFSRFTGERKYLDQAALFIERRGHGLLGEIEFGASYFQDDVPVREATVFNGHAVRALYLAAGAIDVAVETNDTELMHSVVRQTANTIAKRTYLTGGMGAHHSGESFGLDYELPPDRAYSETCAGVGSMMVNYRLLLATGNVEYADQIERVLYNVIAASPARDGRSFFYTNTLHQRAPGQAPRPDQPNPRAASTQRAPWFEVSCCPTNVARTLSSLAAYIATTDVDGLQIHQFADAIVSFATDSGDTIRVRMSTRYPADGAVSIEILESPTREWTLSFRIPAWAGSGASLSYQGKSVPQSGSMATLTSAFVAGETVELTLPVVSRLTQPDPRIDSVRGSIAVERGPLVLCLESADLPKDADLNDIRVTPDSVRDNDGDVSITVFASHRPVAPWPYRTDESAPESPAPITARLIPYHDWANRGPSTMRVWLPATIPPTDRS